MSEEKKAPVFEASFNPKCIYIFRIHDAAHRDLLKIGDATVKTDKPLSELVPNCKTLNDAARNRIKDYTNTAGISYDLLHTELAVMEATDEDGKKTLLSFKDHKVHNVLLNSNIERVEFPDSTAREWFKVDLNTAKKAITAVKEGKKNLSGEQIIENFSPIAFRPEQDKAIKMTLERFRTQHKMLWNAKMRFGKTLSALEVVRQSKFEKTIIITHRPVVDVGWYEDFGKVFYEESDYIYGSKGTGYSLQELLASGKKFVYFASMQDLRGSRRVGGPHDKNEDVFDLEWDLVIVDEAHEGTTTALGDSVIKEVVKEYSDHITKFLALSGTPFNILNNFDKNIYTWDYIMEQRAKAEWSLAHLEPNPYDDLPTMQIFTYDIGKLLFDGRYVELEDKAFNFREFFRVWTGDKKKDGMALPTGVSVGDFYHDEDVRAFLDLICQASEESQYPYSSEEYRNIFKHTLWMVPGVKEARALSKMLKAHPVFSFFEIVNVAGEGDEEEAHDEALKKVRTAIKKAGSDGYTITLSCGKLTTGVSVPEWTAAFYLSGSFSTSASSYLQTIFRVQTPCNKDGKIKNTCYVFDFAPDRTLKMVSEAAAISTKAGGTSETDRQIMGEFLNYCPVISLDGTMMKPYSTDSLLQQLKRAYADRAVRTGFDDVAIYSNDLLKLTKDDLSLLENLKGIIGSSKAAHNTRDININDQGFTDEEHQKAEDAKKKKKKDRTPEEEKLLKELQEKRKQRRDAISILRGISIRMPLLIYGADIPFDDDVTIEQLPDLVDEASWKEFMPKKKKKKKFKELIKFYDPDIFVAAGRRIRSIAKSADELPPIERAQRIAELFSCFKNPDKETVLTPWRVVNMHMGYSLGGWNFFNEAFDEPAEGLRYIDRGIVTANTMADPDAKILEINSKTGLYPLYVTANIFKAKSRNYKPEDLTHEIEEALWEETVKENIFVICKTPMAKSITQRTLAGYKDYKINAHAFDDLLNQVEEKKDKLIKKILNPTFWGKKGKKMFFKAVVGNPPYQSETAKYQAQSNGQATRKSIFHLFQLAADDITSGVTSLIYPGARWIHRSGKGMAQFGLDQINDVTLSRVDFFPNANEIFTDVAIADGISIVFKDKSKTAPGFTYVYHNGGETIETHIDNPGEDLIPLDPRDMSITEKIKSTVSSHGFTYMHDRILPRNLFGIESDFVDNNPEKVRLFEDDATIDYSKEIKLFTNDRAGKAGRATWYIASRDVIENNAPLINEWQVVVSSANAGGQKRDNQLEIIDNHSAFGRSRVALGTFKTKTEAENFFNYVSTYLIRFMFLMTDENLTSLGKRVPDIGDYTNKSAILDFREDLDAQLFNMFGFTDTEIEHIKTTIDER